MFKLQRRSELYVTVAVAALPEFGEEGTNTLKKIVFYRGKGTLRPLPPCASRLGKQTTINN
jgi:hypothetical protein